MASDEAKFFERAKRELFPKMKDSALSITIVGEPDPKLCMELGAAILFYKPIIALFPPGQKVPSNLARVASAIVQGDVKDPAVMSKLQEAITRVMENDARVKGREVANDGE